MKPFEWIQPASVADAVAALARPGAMAIAGGVDLLDRMKENLEAPKRLVSLRKLGLAAIEVDGSGARIGAGVTLAQLADDAALRKAFPIIGDAAGHAATPQLRAMATVGGNLAQRPRCWYFRAESFVCRKKGGTECFALEGDNQMHAIFDNRVCAATHPSTVVTALVALGATVTIAGAKGATRQVGLEQFFVAPSVDVSREVDLKPGEIITGVAVPAAAGVKSAYTKQVAKMSFDWPLVDVAVALTMDGGVCKSARIVLGAVAPVPRRALEAEKALVGAAITADSAARAAKAAVAGATPLSGNDHKVPILEAVVRRTVLAAGEAVMTTRSIDTAPRVELPVLCRFLRCKSAHGDIVDNTAWQLGTSTTEAYWCLATMEAFGPDDGYVHATVCQGQRSCCRRDDGG